MSSEVTPREAHYFWGKFKAIVGIIFLSIVGLFFLGVYANEAIPGDKLFTIDTWMESLQENVAFTRAGKQNLAIDVAKERLEELLAIDTNDKERTLLALYELDKSLVHVINVIDPSQTEVIQALTLQREQTAKLVAILQGVYTPPLAVNENEQAGESAEKDDIIDFGNSLIQSLGFSEETVENNTQNAAPLPTNTPIPTPTKPISKVIQPTPTSTPIPPTPTQPLGQAHEIEFTATLIKNNQTYTMTHNGTTYTVLNGSNYASLVGQQLKIHANLYSNNIIQLTEVEVDD